MVERIERVAGIKGVNHDVGQPFGRKQGYDDTKREKSFASILKNVMKGSSGERGMPAAYSLDIATRATHSLFYENAADLRTLTAKINSDI